MPKASVALLEKVFYPFSKLTPLLEYSLLLAGVLQHWSLGCQCSSQTAIIFGRVNTESSANNTLTPGGNVIKLLCVSREFLDLASIFTALLQAAIGPVTLPAIPLYGGDQHPFNGPAAVDQERMDSVPFSYKMKAILLPFGSLVPSSSS